MSEIKYKRKKRSSNPASEIIISVLFGNIIFSIMLSVFAILIMNISVKSEYLFLFIIASSALAIFISAIYSSRKISKNRLLSGMISGTIIVLIHFLIILCFNNAQLAMRTYFIFPSAILSSFLGSITGINTVKK